MTFHLPPPSGDGSYGAEFVGQPELVVAEQDVWQPAHVTLSIAIRYAWLHDGLRVKMAVLPRVAAAASGIIVLLLASAAGIGVSPDSSAYIAAARNLLHGSGLSIPLPDGGANPLVAYAPLYPTLLAAVGLLGVDALVAARWLNAALFAGNILLSGYIVERGTGSRLAGTLGALLFLISRPILQVHAMAWSEPTFLFVSLLALLWLSEHAIRHRRGYVVAAAVALGLGALTRYAGLSLVGAGVTVLLIGNRHPPRDKVRDCIVFLAITGALCGTWFARNLLVAGTPAARSMVFHPFGLAQLRRAAATIVGWLWPSIGLRRFSLGVAAAGGLVYLLQKAATAASASRDTLPQTNGRILPPVAHTALIFTIVYGVFLVAAMSFFDAPIPLDDRLLCPSFVWTLLGSMCAAHGLVTDPRRPRWLRPLVVFAGIWFAGVHVVWGTQWLRAVHRDGQGYASAAWRDSQIMNRVRQLPATTRIFSNADDAIYLLADRLAERIPERFSPTTTYDNDLFDIEMTRMLRRLSEAAGVIVYFAPFDWRPNLPSPNELEQLLPLRSVYAAADGVIYAVRD